MAVESALFVSGLNGSYPAGSEFVAQGDEHLRLIKTTLLNTFPGFTRAIDADLIPMSTYPASPDPTTVFAKFLEVDNDIASIETYLYSNPLGDALRQANNLSDVTDVAAARANLSVPEASTVALIANNLSDLTDAAQARVNLSVPEASTVMLKAANLSDVANVASARNNLGVAAAADVLLRADNLASVASAATARTNLGAAADADVLKKANNLSDVLSASSARTNLGVYSIAQTDNKIAADIAAALATISIGSFHEKSASFTFTTREDVKVDVSGGAVTATLETSPAVGAYHLLAIGAGDVTVNNITISPNSELFDGVVADQVISVEGVYLIYWKSTANGWTMLNLAAGGVKWAEYNNGNDPVTAPEANFTDALAIGNGAVAGATYAFAFLGNASGSNSIALGRNSASTGAGAIAIGQSSSSSAGVAIGSNADSNGNHAVAIGNNTFANGNKAIVIGNDTTAAGICIGASGAASGCVAMGGSSQSSGAFSTAIGAYYARAEGNYSTAIGTFANTQSKVGCTAIGYYAYCFAEGTIKLGAPCNDAGSYDSGLGAAGLSIAQRRITGNTNASRNVGSIGLEAGKVYNVRVTVVAKQVGGNAVWTRSAQVCALRPAAGSVVLVGTQADLFAAEDATFSGLTTLTLVAGTSTLVANISDSLTPAAEISMEYIAVMEIVNSSSLAD